MEIFSGYRSGTVSEMSFHEPENDIQQEAAKRVEYNSKFSFILFLIIDAFVIYGAILKKTPIMFLIALVFIVFTVVFIISTFTNKEENNKAQVTTAVVASVKPHWQRKHHKSTPKISVAVEYPEKIIVHNNPINQSEHQRCQVGSQVIVAKKGGMVYATLIDNN